MKREGRQHGTVRITRTTTATSSSDTACTKAHWKPTSHSKPTGKCKRACCIQCHSRPVSKSRHKAKGTYKLKCSDVALNHRLASWRVVDGRDEILAKCSGVSASGMLDALLMGSCSSGRYDDDDDYDDYGESMDIDEENVDVGSEDEEEEEDVGFCEVGFVWEYEDEGGWCVVDEM